jgi:hypothetical protein
VLEIHGFYSGSRSLHYQHIVLFARNWSVLQSFLLYIMPISSDEDRAAAK